MKKINKLERILILILILVSIISLSQIAITSNVILSSSNEYSYTKAICDEKNYCEDYIIECEGKNVKQISPTGFSVQHNSDWTDPREENQNFCE